jgi:LAGLIDADG endonuclease
LLKIIPLFKEYNLQGSKKLDFMDFCKVAELLNNKAHLTEQPTGLILILNLKNGMNKGRF